MSLRDALMRCPIPDVYLHHLFYSSILPSSIKGTVHGLVSFIQIVLETFCLIQLSLRSYLFELSFLPL